MIETKNAHYTENGNINCDYNHPDLGWIPFTAEPNGRSEEMQNVWDHLQTQEVIPYVSPEPTGTDVNTERSRRIYMGGTFDVEGYGPVPLLGDPETISNLDSLALKAQIRIGNGKGDTITKYRDAVNVNHELTQPMVVDLWEKATAYLEAVYDASWELKDNGPIPEDYTAEKHWP